jgi:hypothetical protein
MTDVDICNVSLGYLGDSATVTSIDPPEGSAQAQHCARFYPMAVQVMLDGHDWNFTTMRQTLALIQENYFQWRYVYAVPGIANTVLSVQPQAQYTNANGTVFLPWFYEHFPMEFELNATRDFSIEMVNDKMCILSNTKNAVARFTTMQVKPGQFPALFTDALAWKLASMLAGPVIKGDEGRAMAQKCLAAHVNFLGQAKTTDANQKKDQTEAIPSGILARW